MELTTEQRAAIDNLRSRWQTVSEPSSAIGSDQYVMVEVTGENGCSMVLGIETDGYTHS